jgi:hypothetical protein
VPTFPIGAKIRFKNFPLVATDKFVGKLSGRNLEKMKWTPGVGFRVVEDDKLVVVRVPVELRPDRVLKPGTGVCVLLIFSPKKNLR